MGSTLSMIKGHGRRLLNRYNAQNRALDLLEFERLPEAPRHPSNVGAKDNFNGTSAASEITCKNVKLDEYLKNIYVHSFDETPKNLKSCKSLPVRKEVDDRVTFPEPTEITPGYCTLAQASKFLAAHDDDSDANNARTISKEYNLNEETVEHVLKYYTVFRLVSGENRILKHKTFEEELFEVAKKTGRMKEIEENIKKDIYWKPLSLMLKSFIKKNEEQEKSKDQLQTK